MKWGVSVPNIGGFADPERVQELACTAERAGWDGFFVWDHLLFSLEPVPVGDVWVLLTAAACATERVRLGPMVAALPRRAPWDVARQAVTLDRLSGGRVVLGVGLGSPAEADFAPFGLTTDLRARARHADEALSIIDSLWSGEAVSFGGEHFTVEDVTFLPRPLQRPRIPIWVGFGWPSGAPVRRAARWDGAIPLRREADGRLIDTDAASLTEIADVLARNRGRGPGDDGYALVATGASRRMSAGEAAEATRTRAAAGATWWLETFEPWRDSPPRALEALAAGPPTQRSGR